MVTAHGNSLRALIKYLDDIGDEEIVKLEIPTGTPNCTELDEQLHPLSREYSGTDFTCEVNPKSNTRLLGFTSFVSLSQNCK